MDLHMLGWDERFIQLFAEHSESGLKPARVAQEHKKLYTVWMEAGERSARVTGKFHHEAKSRADFPAVGDWVAVDVTADNSVTTIHAVLPRRSSFSRKAVLAGGPKYGDGRIEEQVLSANVDTAFLVTGLDNDFNLRRIERYLAVAWESGCSPVIVLNKADVCDDVAERVAKVEEISVGTPVQAISAATGDSIDLLRQYLGEGRTGAFLGSSGVGKSTIINRLLGEDRLDTGGVRLDDSRGRHTTTSRELLLLPGGGVVIDTPGMREIALWGEESGLSRAFEDIEQLMGRCRFGDCSHESEPGCALREAIERGDLDPKRYASYLKLQKESHNLAVRKDVRQRREENRARDKRYRRIHKDREELKKKGLI
jgi:ribosome biogenesis GTPase